MILIVIVIENERWMNRMEAPLAAYSAFYANGVKPQSPASWSARWVTDHPHNRTPTGFHKKLPILRWNEVRFGSIGCGTPLGFLIFFHSNPVCASRHWALEWNCFAVHSSHAGRRGLPSVNFQLKIQSVFIRAHPWYNSSEVFDHDQDHDFGDKNVPAPLCFFAFLQDP